jgi:ketosteroid isomerase-like protein
MKRTLCLLAMLAACTTLPADDAPASLAAAETAFAAHSVREDMRVAFLAHFAPGGVLVREGWRTAREAWEPQPAPPIVLDWRPVYVETAASGEMGMSTGPWRITPRGAAAPQRFGQFFSIWSREPGGPWRVDIDIGIPHPQPVLWDAPLVAVRTPAVPGAAGSLEEAEAAFAQLAATQGAAAWQRWGAQDLRLYREGSPPRLGLFAALPAVDAKPARWIAERTATAASRDFGYARGTVRGLPAGELAGYYLHVWRREAGGWRLVADVFNAAAKG